MEKKTIDERADEYVDRAFLQEGTYKGDVQSTYCVACSDQNRFLVSELEEEIAIQTKKIEDILSDISPENYVISHEKMDYIRERMNGLSMAIEIIKQWPNDKTTVHASRYEGVDNNYIKSLNS